MKIIFLGSQGSGKSTQAKLAAQKLHLPWIEMGQLLRDRVQTNDQVAAEIRKALEIGNLAPDNVVIKTLQERLTQPDCSNGYVLDGFPRNYAQLEGLNPDIDKVFYIQVSDPEGIERLMKRARSDDTLSVITKRLENYHKQTKPLLDYFRQKGLLAEIDGERTIEEIEKDIKARIINEEPKNKI
jgi:adenylate kinase